MNNRVPSKSIFFSINPRECLRGNVPQVELLINFKPILAIPLLLYATKFTYPVAGCLYDSKIFKGCL